MIELITATMIPLQTFDAEKLETLLRRIPSALERVEEMPDFERRHYLFPKLDDKGFKIQCSADHYFGSSVPSWKTCSLAWLKELDPRRDEQVVEFRDPSTVRSLFTAISYNADVKKFFSSEQVYGLGANSEYRKLFRYSITCQEERCLFSTTLKPASN